jgi:hypothetical protein
MQEEMCSKLNIKKPFEAGFEENEWIDVWQHRLCGATVGLTCEEDCCFKYVKQGPA